MYTYTYARIEVYNHNIIKRSSTKSWIAYNYCRWIYVLSVEIICWLMFELTICSNLS